MLGYTDLELESLIQGGESQTVEFKASAASKKDICQTVCAFCNDLPGSGKPGVLFIGVDNAGCPVGLVVDDKLLQELGKARMDGQILPLPDLDIERRTLRGKGSISRDVAVVMVRPSSEPPVRFRNEIFIRTGPASMRATRDQERVLVEKRRSQDVTFDLRPSSSASLSDLDLAYFQGEYLPTAISPDVLAENERSLEHQLASLRFLTPDHRPTVGALLVLGKDPLRFIPGAYVQFVRFEGTELYDPIRHQARISGRIREVVQQTEMVIAANISVRTTITGSSTEVRQPDYPLEALRQLVRNAIMHRNYETSNDPIRVYWFSDRIEIGNAGGPFGKVSPATFGKTSQTDYRNPLLAEAMRVQGYVQQFGVGLAIASRELSRNGNPPWEYSGTDAYTLLTIRSRP